MEFDDALALYERDLKQVVNDWDGLRDAYTRDLKTKGAAAAQETAKTWLGGMEAVAGISDMKGVVSKLQAAGRKLDQVDAALIKLANSFIGTQKTKEAETAEKAKETAARQKEIRGQQKVYPGVVYSGAKA